MFSLLIHHLRYSIYRSSKRQCKRLFFFNFNINCLICQEVLNFFGVKLQKIGAIFQYAAILLFNCADCIADCVQKVVRSEGFPDAWNTEFFRFMQRFVILRSCKEYYRNRYPDAAHALQGLKSVKPPASSRQEAQGQHHLKVC